MDRATQKRALKPSLCYPGGQRYEKNMERYPLNTGWQCTEGELRNPLMMNLLGRLEGLLPAP